MPADDSDPQPVTLHLLEPPRASGGGRESTLFAWTHQRQHTRTDPERVILLGDSMSGRWARAHGIAWGRRITPPGGSIALAWPPLLGALRERRPDVIHCWSPASLRLACALARFHRAAVRATLVEAPSGPERLIRRTAGRIERVECFDDQDASAWRALGLDVQTLELPAPQRQTPPGDPRRDARERFNHDHRLDASAMLLGTLFDHPRETDARRFSFLLAILAVSEHQTTGLAPVGARHVEAARRYARTINREYRLLFSGSPLIDQLRALDACVIPDPTRPQARGARRVLEHAARQHGVRAFERPAFAGLSGPTPPEMIRPMLDVLEGAA